MTRLDRLSFLNAWLIAELLDLVLRPIWLRSKRSFVAAIDRLDCYPCRVGCDLGDFPQMWIETPVDAARTDWAYAA